MFSVCFGGLFVCVLSCNQVTHIEGSVARVLDSKEEKERFQNACGSSSERFYNLTHTHTHTQTYISS